MPEIKGIMKSVSDLEGIENFEIDSNERIVISRKGEDRSLAEAAYQRQLLAEDIENEVPREQGSVAKVKLEVGWQLWVKESEEVQIAYNCAMYNAEVRIPSRF